MKRKPVVIAYDISNPLRRRKVFKRLQAWRIDGQKSVHECLLNLREAEELYVQLYELINPDTDHLLLAWVSRNRVPRGLGAGHVDNLFRRFLHVA